LGRASLTPRTGTQRPQLRNHSQRRNRPVNCPRRRCATRCRGAFR
jgi:hypothetical protein